MKENVYNIVDALKKWCFANPKKVYIISFALLILSFSASIFRHFYFPPKKISEFVVPSIQNSSEDRINKMKYNESQMKKIAYELESFKEKRDTQTLTKGDSLRIEYLILEYNKLKNELEKN